MGNSDEENVWPINSKTIMLCLTVYSGQKNTAPPLSGNFFVLLGPISNLSDKGGNNGNENG